VGLFEGREVIGLRRIIRSLSLTIIALIESFIVSLPSASPFSKWRNWYWRQRGYSFSKTCFLSRNVYFLGEVSIGDGSFIGDNCILNGVAAGISIGKKVMIAPNCVLVAFDHGFRNLETPMMDQLCEVAPIVIEDDVWIAANCTIAKGVRLGRGCIVSANSLVRINVEPFAAVRGVPAKVIGSRKTTFS
jgi:acetyltransferase-like isoleucine patch superfamily enzyme